MNEDAILKNLALPKQTYILRTFPYNKLVTQLNERQRQVFSDFVESRGIRLLATLNSHNTNIPKYEDHNVRFEEIHFFLIRVKNLNKSSEIYKALAQTIPYPLMILFESNETYQWVAATHHKQAHTHLLAIEKVYKSNMNIALEKYLTYCHFDNMDKLDLKSYFTMFIKRIIELELQEQYAVTTEVSLENDVLEKIQALDKQIATLVHQAKNEKQMNKRIALQVEANKLKDEKVKLIEMENKHD